MYKCPIHGIRDGRCCRKAGEITRFESRATGWMTTKRFLIIGALLFLLCVPYPTLRWYLMLGQKAYQGEMILQGEMIHFPFLGPIYLVFEGFEYTVGVAHVLIAFGFGLFLFLILMIIPTFLWISNRRLRLLRDRRTVRVK